MPRLAKQPTPATASDLKRLAARRRKQEEALDDTRAETARVVQRAINSEGATPAAVARLVRLDRTHVWRIAQTTTEEATTNGTP